MPDGRQRIDEVHFAAIGVVLSSRRHPCRRWTRRTAHCARAVCTAPRRDGALVGTAHLSICADLNGHSTGRPGLPTGRQADRLAALSETDALTGLANRRALGRRLGEEFRRSKRYRTPVSLLLVDIDGLKQLNDTHGHVAGDRMIRIVADAIVRGLREADFGARWGGDEFAILAPNTSADAAHASAERLIARVANQRDVHLRRRPTVSIGVATHDPADGRHADPDALVRAADDALYRAKAGGRNRVDAA